MTCIIPRDPVYADMQRSDEHFAWGDLGRCGRVGFCEVSKHDVNSEKCAGLQTRGSIVHQSFVDQ